MIQGEVLEGIRSTPLEWLVGAPKGSLVQVSYATLSYQIRPPPSLMPMNLGATQNLDHLSSWISLQSPDPVTQSAFYRSLQVGISWFITDEASISAACTASPLWLAAKIEVATANAVADSGPITDVPGLSDCLTPVLHLAAIWGAVIRLELSKPKTSPPVTPHATITRQLERLLQGFVDIISPCTTLDLLLTLLCNVADKMMNLPPLQNHNILFALPSQESLPARVTITHRT